MRIAVFGCGYVGLTTAVGLAELGNNVMAVDIDPTKIESLKSGKVPFFEPRLQALLQRNITEKRLMFSTDGRSAISKSEIVFCAVGTPVNSKIKVDLSGVYNVAKLFTEVVNKTVHVNSWKKIFINKSTVPIGENKKIAAFIANKIKKNAAANFSYFYNPEFLREGSALEDFFKPDRIIIGVPVQPTSKVAPTSKVHIKKLYSRLLKNGTPIMFTDLYSAEIIKYASNAFLATKISFINEISDLTLKTGGDINQISKGMGMDKRIGPDFLQAGIGFGGSCLPKDLKTLISIGEKSGLDLKIMKAVEGINNQRPLKLIYELKKKLFVDDKKTGLKNKKIAIWGAAFKPNTDDLRDAPALKIIKYLLKQKSKVRVYDPAALPNLRKIFGSKIQYGHDQYEILKNADALLLLTEWEQFQNPDFKKLKNLMRKLPVIYGRHFTKLN